MTRRALPCVATNRVNQPPEHALSNRYKLFQINRLCVILSPQGAAGTRRSECTKDSLHLPISQFSAESPSEPISGSWLRRSSTTRCDVPAKKICNKACPFRRHFAVIYVGEMRRSRGCAGLRPRTEDFLRRPRRIAHYAKTATS